MLKSMTGERWWSILVPRSVLQNSIHHLPHLLILPFLNSHQLGPEPLLSFFICLVFWPPLSRHFAPAYHTPQEASCLSILHSCHRGNKISCRNKCQAFSLLSYDRLSDSLGCGISPGFSVTASSRRHMSSRASLQHIPDFAIHSPIPKAGKEQSFPLLLLWDTLQMHTAGLTARASSGRGLLSIVSWAPRSSPLYDKCGKLRTLTVPSQFTLVCFTFFFFLMWEAE